MKVETTKGVSTMKTIITRKDALKVAIAILTENGGYEEEITLLEDLYDEMPLTHWSDKSIRDSVNQFIKDFDRVPSCNDFARFPQLPPHPVIRNRYGITLAEWLDENYDRYKPTREELKQKYTEEFLKDYYRIKPKAQEEFNRNRTEGTRGWQTLAQYYEVKSWRNLLKKMGLPLYHEMKKDRVPPEFTVSVLSDLEF